MSAAASALADQITAATAEAHGVLDHLVLNHGMHPGTAVPDRWLRRLVADAVRRPCEHLRFPQPAFVICHERRLACADCQHAAAVALRGTAEDGTCDRCRRRQPGNRLTTAMTTAGPVLIPMGLCDHCLSAVHREPGARTSTRSVR